MDDAIALQQVRDTLLKLTRGGRRLQPKTVKSRLMEATGLSRLEVTTALAQLAVQRDVSNVDRFGEPRGMVSWIGETPDSSSSREWEAALEQLPSPLKEASRRQALRDCYPAVEGLSGADLQILLSTLLQSRQDSDADATLRSARHVMGSAKALKNLRRLATLLEVGDTTDAGGEFYVLTAGPEQPRALVLIENARCFSAFARSRHVHYLLGIACYGYGLTMESFGDRLQRNQVVACPAYGQKVSLTDLLPHTPTVFWGDLDLEGLRIFESLKAHIPHLELSLAYADMAKLLSNPMRSHPYHSIFEKAGQRPPAGRLPEVRHLAELCSRRAVDQEAICDFIDEVDVGRPFKI